MCGVARGEASQPSRLLRVALLALAVSKVFCNLRQIQLRREMLIAYGIGAQKMLSR